MRVAYVCSDAGVPVFGRKGASVHVQAVLRVLVARGAEVHLIAARTGGAVPPGLEPVRVHPLPAVSGQEPADRERSAQASDAAVQPVLDQLAHDTPFDVLYERYSLWGRTATAWARGAGVPSILEVNAPLVAEQAEHRVLLDRVAAGQVADAALSTADVVLCVSEGVAGWARRVAGSPERVHVVANGVDAVRVRPADRPVIGSDAVPFVIGFVGTLKPWHGVATLVDALVLLQAARPDEYRLLLVGDGPEAASLRARAATAGVAHLVEFTGPVDPADVPELLHRMDVAVAPYPGLTDFYFSPLKVYEYLAAGLPVVASGVGELPAVLEQGALGSLVEPDDPRALAAALADLRSDEQRRTALRSQTRTAALTRHTWDGVVDRALGLLSRRSRQPADA